MFMAKRHDWAAKQRAYAMQVIFRESASPDKPHGRHHCLKADNICRAHDERIKKSLISDAQWSDGVAQPHKMVILSDFDSLLSTDI